jgi:putative ABC transport system ATP-binding protein
MRSSAPPGAVSGLVLAAGAHHHAVRILILAVIVVVAVAALGVTGAFLVRRARRGRAGGAAEARPRPGGQQPPPGNAAITVEHLTKTYRMGSVPVRALDDVSLQIPAGAMVCIMGKSGSGKSTLLRQLGLIDIPTSGSIWLRQQEVTALPERERTRLRLRALGYVFQEYALLPELTAAENVYLPAMMLGAPRQRYRDRADELLDLVGLAGRARHRPRELSGGEQQRVAIARALVNQPTIIYADEPTANLDTASARTVMETLRKLNQTLGVTVLFVSHDPDDARYATQLVHLSDGKATDPDTSGEQP